MDTISYKTNTYKKIRFRVGNLKSTYRCCFLFLLSIIFLFLISIKTFEISYGQSNFLDTESTTSVTSYLDALLKAPLLISQALVVGVTFVHSFVVIRLFKKEPIFFDNHNSNLFLSFLIENKVFVIITMVCGIIILIMSTIVIVFQSFLLSLDLGLDLLSTFSILISSTVGNIFIIKFITSIFIIVLGLLYYCMGKRFTSQLLRRIQFKTEHQLQQQNYTKKRTKILKILIVCCISIAILGSINIFSNSIQSHNAAVDFFPSIAISVDWLHFMMVSIWVGGLFYISLTLSQKLFVKENLINENQDHNHRSIKDSNISFNIQLILSTILCFSFISVISLGIIFITGLYMGVLHLQQPSSLTDSIYGNILIFKLIIVFSMALLGVYHHFKIPKLINQQIIEKTQTNQIQIQNLKRFNKTLRVEYFLGIGIIFVSSFLTVTSPPQHDSHNMNMLSIMPPLEEDSYAQKMMNIHNQSNYPFDQSFSIIALIISISIAISIIILVKRSWKILKLYNEQSNQSL